MAAARSDDTRRPYDACRSAQRVPDMGGGIVGSAYNIVILFTCVSELILLLDFLVVL